jgi:O-antigen/teichoic acid export membrane protein
VFGASRISAVSFVSGAGLLEASWLSALSFGMFGVFGRAMGLGQLLCGRVAGLLAQSVFPVLARIPPRSDSYRKASALYLRSVTWFVVPLGLASALLADPIVRLLYGNQWLGVIPLLPWAMAGVGIAAVVQTGYVLLLAHQQQNRCLVADIWRLAGTAIALASLAGFGMQAYLAGMAAVHAISLALVLYWLQDGEAVSRRGLVEAIAPPLGSAAIAALVAEVIRRVVVPGEMSLTVAVVEAASLGLMYVILLRVGFRQQLEELVEQLPERRRLSRLLRLQRAA